ncbi:MAG: RNA polymerase factor sigma-54 [Rhizobacter sp.]|nr:RNA polymerase factor sigma-54 [Rhizobacter sp.]
MTSMYLHTEQRQQQGLSPRLQQAVRLLQLSSLDFAREVQAAADSNPFLDTVDDEPQETPPEPGAQTAAEPAPTGTLEAAALPASPDDADSDADADRESWQTGGPSDGPRSDDVDASPMNRVAAETSLSEHLIRQLHVLPLSPRDMLLAEAIVESLDDDGYLRLGDLAELIPVIELDPAVTVAELQIALRRVQSLEPAGVGARSVVECLLLQLDGVACPRERELVKLLVSEKLESLASKDVATLARQVGRPVDEVSAACARIRRLDPRPGWRFGSADIRYITPDVTVKKVRNVWTVSLNPAIVPKVRLHRVYAEMFQRHQQAQHPELASQLREARWTLRNVEQRFATILGVAQAIVKRQHHFFDYGPLAMKPMGLKEIADEVGVHESTVSRVTNNKYMATPLGVFELKYFFSRAMTATSGSAFSGTAIRGLIKDMIDNEKPDAPLSDAEITRQLAQQGFVVARRTVTKYRHLLRVEPVERRRTGG